MVLNYMIQNLLIPSDNEPESPDRFKFNSKIGFICPTCNYEFPSKQRLENI